MKLYGRYFSIHLRSAMQYPASFWMTFVGQFLAAFSAFLSIYFLFDRFHAVEGFTYQEVLLCFASVMLSFSFCECFFRGFDRFPSLLGNGQFDRILIRPRSTIFQVLCAQMDFSRLGKFFQAVLVFCYAIPASGVEWTWPRVLTLCGMLLGGVAIFAGLFLFYAGASFFTIEGLEVLNIFIYGGREFGSYPAVIYGKAILKFWTFVIPMAMIQYYPLLFLLGRTDGVWNALSPLATLLFLIPAYLFWRFGLRHYRSTGS